MLKTQTARQYRSQHPDMPSLKLARIMYKENKKLYKDVEDARSSLRYIEGKGSSGHKVKSVKESEFFREEARPKNPYKLPSSDEAIYEPYILTGHKRIALFSDIHVPYHSVSALTAAIEYAKKEKVDGLVLNGDTLDFHTLSRFNKDPRKKNFAQELEIFKQLLQVFKKELKCKIYFKIGNHEERYDHYLGMKAGELDGVEEFSMKALITGRADVEFITDKRIIKANDLNIIHGHEFGMSVFSPVNIARGLFLKAKVSAIQGHNHATSEHTESNMNGKITTTWSQGCLCELNPAYLPINKWNHGFAIVDLDENGVEFEVRNKRIHKGKVL